MRIILLVSIITILFGCAGRKYPAPIAEISAPKTPYTKQYRNSISDDTYEVQASETLYSISFRAGIDYRTLAQINGISAPYTVYPGQILELTQKGSETVAENAKYQPKYQPVNEEVASQKNNKKTIANEKSEEYGKKQASQKLKNAVQKQLVKKDSFPKKVKQWRYPSKGKIIDTYSTKENGNKGIDFGGKLGDPIIAAADGKVVYAGSALRGFGNLIIVKHNNDYLSAYAHNRVLKVKEQDWVKAGQLIAEMGNSGTDSVKLHFEIRFRGRTVNPLKYLPKK